MESRRAGRGGGNAIGNGLTVMTLRYKVPHMLDRCVVIDLHRVQFGWRF